jgi:hypothetical protein
MSPNIYKIQLENPTWGSYTFFAEGATHSEALHNAMRAAKEGRPGGGTWEVWLVERLDGRPALTPRKDPA